MDSRHTAVGRKIAHQKHLSRWHCVFCEKKLKTLGKREAHENEEHPVQIELLTIEDLWQKHATMNETIEEYFALGELLKTDVDAYVEPLIKRRMSDLARDYRTWGWGKVHPLERIEQQMKRHQTRLSQLIARDAS